MRTSLPLLSAKSVAAVRWGLLALVAMPLLAIARLGGQWFELPPAYFSQSPEITLLPVSAALRSDHAPVNDYPGFRAMKRLAQGPTMQRITNNRSGSKTLHRYSKQQAWNADESVIDVGDRLLDAQSLEVLTDKIDLSTARNWSYTNPQLFYGIRYVGGVANVLASYNIASGEHVNIHRFDQHKQCTFGAGEGNVSRDERYVLVSCKRRDNGQTELLSIDLHSGALLGTQRAKSGYNWASFSQSGRYIIVENKADGGNSQTELVRYSPSLKHRHVLTTSRNHGDLGLDVHGNDVFVMIDWDYISYIHLDDGKRVNLAVSSPTTTPAGHGHISCRNVRRPGWCYFSSYERGLVGAVRLAEANNAVRYTDNDGLQASTGIAEVEIWGHHHSNSSSYEAQPKVTASPTGSQLIFSSDWYGTATVDDYLLNIAQ